MPSQLRNFVFTWNNPGKIFPPGYENEGNEMELRALADAYLEALFQEQEIPIKFITYGYEHGEEGTPHFQGYCELESRVSFNRVTEYFNGCHIESRKGTQLQAITYCRKGGDVVTYGEPKIQGNRSDLQHIKSMLDLNSSIKALLDEGEIDSLQGLKVAEKLLKYTDKRRDYEPQVLWLYGAAGVGKTRLARELLPNAYFKTNLSYKWWPSYDGEEDIIIDDLRKDNYPYITMLGLLDRYPYQVEDKGTIREFKGRRIIITSHRSPEDVYYRESLYDEKIDQLLRRLTLVEELK